MRRGDDHGKAHAEGWMVGVGGPRSEPGKRCHLTPDNRDPANTAMAAIGACLGNAFGAGAAGIQYVSVIIQS
jgi:hypothetical protein